MIRIRQAIAAVLSLLSLASIAAVAQPYPSRPIQMIVPFPAGGPADIVGRLYALELSKLAGQPVVVENISGAAGIIGTQNAARAEPNGYTILFGTTSTIVINQVVMPKVPYNFQTDFAQVGLIANAPHILAIRSTLPVASAPELIAMAKREPGKLTFASAGTGSIVQMGGELFKFGAGIDIVHIPYKGGGPATMALLKDEVDMTVNDLSTLKSNIEAGKLRPLAVAHTSRLKPLPDVPTFTELGMPQIVSSTWWGIAVPVKTPDAIVQQLRVYNDTIIRNPAYVARVAEMAIDPIVLTPQETKEFIANEIAKWKSIAAKANIQVD